MHNCQEFSQPLECLYQAMQTQEKVFYCFYKLTFPRKKKNSLFRLLIKREILTSREVLYTKLNVRVISSCFAIKMLTKKGFSCLKCQLKGMGKLSKFVQFSTKKYFKIRACVISARRAKHLDSTHVYILSCKHISRPIKERAYYLSYS